MIPINFSGRPRKLALLSLGLFFLLGSARAQQKDRELFTKQIQSLVVKYKMANHLSFDLNYTCYPEGQPANIVDSMRGAMKIHGKSYWYSIDSTESVGGDTLALSLFKQDKIMLLARPSKQVLNTNPLAVLDSMFTRVPGMQLDYSSIGGEDVFTLLLPPGLKYKRLEYHIDPLSGYLTRMLMVVQSDELYEPEAKAYAAQTGNYAVVETRFSNYLEGSFDDRVFDLSQYFTHVGQNYTPTAIYSTFSIHLGSPDL